MGGTGKLLFASDVHWRPCEDAHTLEGDPFACFLKEAARRARGGEVSDLYIIGDLFDVWFENRGRGLSGYRHHAAALARAQGAGLNIHVLYGNRDFLYRTALQKATGVELLGDRAELTLRGRSVLLHHGDLYCSGDRSYQVFRRCIRSLPMRILAGLLPLKTLETITAKMIQASKSENTRKGLQTTSIVDKIVIGEHRRGFATIICGHVHQAGRRRLAPDRTDWELITLCPWIETSGSYLEFDGQTFALKEFSV